MPGEAYNPELNKITIPIPIFIRFIAFTVKLWSSRSKADESINPFQEPLGTCPYYFYF